MCSFGEEARRFSAAPPRRWLSIRFRHTLRLGGSGHLTSVRGGGPLTTLIDPVHPEFREDPMGTTLGERRDRGADRETPWPGSSGHSCSLSFGLPLAGPYEDIESAEKGSKREKDDSGRRGSLADVLGDAAADPSSVRGNPGTALWSNRPPRLCGREGLPHPNLRNQLFRRVPSPPQPLLHGQRRDKTSGSPPSRGPRLPGVSGRRDRERR